MRNQCEETLTAPLDGARRIQARFVLPVRCLFKEPLIGEGSVEEWAGALYSVV